MFLDDIRLVTEQVNKHGLKKPFVDLGGQAVPTLVDYDRLPESPFIQLDKRPYDHLDPDYLILNPERGDAAIENIQETDAYGTIVCTSVLEHVVNPFDVFKGLYRCLKSDGLLIVSTVFSYRYHPAPVDYWRFTPSCLEMLAKQAGLKVLECGWRVYVLLQQNDEWNLVRSVYVVATK